MTAWQSQSRTHTGRRATNEDALVCRDGDGLWAVIDGMGGHDAGDLAATMVGEALERLFLGGGLGHRIQAVEFALQSANHAIRHHAALNLGGRTMGATVAVLLIHGDEGAALWAGDARLYGHRPARTELLTRDHTPVQALLDAGELSEAAALRHPKAHVIHQAIGNGEQLQLEQARFPVAGDTAFWLTTDGVHGVFTLDDMHERLAGNPAPGTLMKAALDAGSRDNLTAVAVRPR